MDSTVETVYTVPGATSAVIKNVIVSNPSTATTITLSIGADAAATRWLDAYAIAANSNTNLFFYLPMATGEILQAKSAADDVIVLTVGGDEIT